MKDTNNQDKSFQERLAEAEERSKNETISDIIVAKRREADSIEASARGSFKAGEDLYEMPFTESDLEFALDLAETKRKEADRLEAALKRELSKNTSKNGADFGQLGDAAKLREALVQAELFVGNIVRHGHQTLVPGDKCTACDGAEELRDMICAALAEPVRNCDVGTAEEQYKRFMNMCNSKDVRKCAECSMRGFTPGCSRDRCFANWAQMPYEGGAK